MIPEYDPGFVPQATQAVIDLTAHPDAVITTYGDIGQLVLLVAAVCMVVGYFIGRGKRGEVAA